MATYTIRYTTARTSFTISTRAFATDTINVYYSPSTADPVPPDIMQGAVLVDPSSYTVEGIGARANSFVVTWPSAPTSGTLIVELLGSPTRVSTFPDNQLPSGAALNAEFDHLLSLIDQAQDDIDTIVGNVDPNIVNLETLDARVTTNENDIASLQGRVTTNENDIASLQGRVTTNESNITSLQNTVSQHTTEIAALDQQIDQLVLNSGQVPPVDAGDLNKALVVTNDSVGSEAWGWQRIGTDSIANSAVTTAKIALNAVTNNRIADSAVGTSKIANSAVTTAKIALNAVTNNRIADGAVTTAKIALNAVTNNRIADGAVTTDKIANGAVTGAKIAANAITAGHIAPNAVGDSEIANSAVTTDKIANGDVTRDKIRMFDTSFVINVSSLSPSFGPFTHHGTASISLPSGAVPIAVMTVQSNYNIVQMHVFSNGVKLYGITDNSSGIVGTLYYIF